MLVARRFSITNFLIATSALGFQVFVLYPWHTKLDDDFDELKRENLRLVHEIEKWRSSAPSSLSPSSVANKALKQHPAAN